MTSKSEPLTDEPDQFITLLREKFESVIKLKDRITVLEAEVKQWIDKNKEKESIIEDLKKEKDKFKFASEQCILTNADKIEEMTKKLETFLKNDNKPTTTVLKSIPEPTLTTLTVEKEKEKNGDKKEVKEKEKKEKEKKEKEEKEKAEKEKVKEIFALPKPALEPETPLVPIKFEMGSMYDVKPKTETLIFPTIEEVSTKPISSKIGNPPSLQPLTMLPTIQGEPYSEEEFEEGEGEEESEGELSIPSSPEIGKEISLSKTNPEDLEIMKNITRDINIIQEQLKKRRGEEL
jgi:hypothetical protein